MYDWSDVQSIVTKSLPHDALRRLRVLEGDLQQDVQQRTDFLNRVRDRIDSLSKVIGEEPTNRVQTLIVAEHPMTPKAICDHIPGAQYHEVWRLFSKPNKGIKPLVDEPFINTIGFGRDRRYEIPKAA